MALTKARGAALQLDDDLSYDGLDDGIRGFRIVKYPLTLIEQSSGKTPTNYEYEPGSVRRFGVDNDGVTDYSAKVQNCADSISSTGGIVSFYGLNSVVLGSQVTIQKHTMVDLAGCTINCTINDVIFYFNKNGVSSGDPTVHGGDGGLSTWIDVPTGIKNGRIVGDTVTSRQYSYAAASDRCAGFQMTDIDISYCNGAQINGESWLANISNVRVYNVPGIAFIHQLDPWGTWEETPGVPITDAYGPNGVNYNDVWVENLTTTLNTTGAYDIATGSANISGGYIEHLGFGVRGGAFNVTNITFGSRDHDTTLIERTRDAYVNVDDCFFAISNTNNTVIFKNSIEGINNYMRINGNHISISYFGSGPSSCVFLTTYPLHLVMTGNHIINKATNVGTVDLFHSSGVGYIESGSITGNVIESQTSGYYINFCSVTYANSFSSCTITGNKLYGVVNYVPIRGCIITNNEILGNNAETISLNIGNAGGFYDNRLSNATLSIAYNDGTSAVRHNANGLTYNYGSYTANGDGATQVFNIAHGLTTTPTIAHVMPKTSDSAANHYIYVDATNIVLNFPTAPPSGANNVNFYWSAEV